MKISNQIELFELELRRKGFRNNSITNYVSCVNVFLNYFRHKDSVKHISEQDIKNFLFKFKEHNSSEIHRKI
jgi:site-specific recombinase XerD